MVLFNYLILSVVILVATLFITRLELPYIFPRNIGQRYDLIIAILSRRENFEQRRTLRNTWLSMEMSDTDLSFKHFFVVGSQPCNVPPEDRTQVYSCDRIQYNIKHVTNSTKFYLTSTKNTLKHGPVYNVLRFQVHHPVLISKLGISLSELKTSNKTITVALNDAASQVEVAKTQFTNFNRHHFAVIDGFAYRPIEPIILPKDFEGVLYTSGSEPQAEEFAFEATVNLDNGGGTLTFDMVEDKLAVPYALIEHNLHITVSMGFSVYDIESLRCHLAEKDLKQHQWDLQMADVSMSLMQEMMEHDDIALVDVVDVYRHLPHKVLAFAKLVVDNFQFQFFLKTDDDSFIHLHRIATHIREDVKTRNVMKWWSGRFRSNWLVQRVGKWKETDYSPAVYPSFACGSASLLSADLIRWLAKSVKHLHPFQGEDVSLGIWLSGLAPNLIQDIRWQCDDGCAHDAFTRGQLNVSAMNETWNCLKRSKSFCCEY